MEKDIHNMPETRGSMHDGFPEITDWELDKHDRGLSPDLRRRKLGGHVGGMAVELSASSDSLRAMSR
jgi:hypothetical protein